jgi:hypothetical protein
MAVYFKPIGADEMLLIKDGVVWAKEVEVLKLKKEII